MWSLIVHGGAGAIGESWAAAHRAGTGAALEAGARRLAAGGSAMDAVRAAIHVLEDDPAFNAGVGAALDEHGMPTLDAALMRGSDLAYGAVAAVAGVRHPIDGALAVLEDRRHCLLVGAGALELLRARGVELCDPVLQITDKARAEWAARRAELAGGGPLIADWRPGDTVGAVALDPRGELCAGTSTGGVAYKRAGRVGDSPIAGAGTYADRELGAISATGHGETMLRTTLAYRALLGLAGANQPSAHLAGELERARARAGGRGGLIALTPDGRVAFARNTEHMAVAWARADGGTGSDF